MASKLHKRIAPWDSELELIDEFTVRSPKKDELPIIHRLYLEIWKEIYGPWNLHWSDQKILHEFHLDKLPLSAWLVVEHNEQVVGFLRHSICLRRLDKIFVARSYRRTGAGYALIREYFWRVARKYTEPVRLSLELFEDLHRSETFFSYFGYVRTGLNYTVGTSHKELVLMEKTFTPLK